MKNTFAILCLGLGLGLSLNPVRGAETPITPVPFHTPDRLPDVAQLVSPAAVHLDGWLGERVLANATNRLLMIDTEPLLAGFRKKPGTHPWIGEHIGKWLHAATLAWANTGDPRLRVKLDAAAAELIKAQEPDGYLGTYVPEKRFGLYKGADWDVWSHKYCLIGLLTYYQFTGNEAALNACRKAGDLLVSTFGPGKKSILSAGTHMGMAATSVLEPMVLLYRFTGDERYLDFCRYLVKSWDEPNGPKLIAALLSDKQVNKTANGKAYEMLSNLVGLCELARATGDRNLLEPVVIAWEDIAAKRLYLTGSASQGEHFQNDYDLPNATSAHVAETCVTTTWIQLNLQLLRLTGEARFANELERTFYNHLAAAQNPRGDDWCYFTSLEGRKPYDAGINCCHSSGPRGMALAPLAAYFIAGDALVVNTLEPSHAVAELAGQPVAVEQIGGFPRLGHSWLKFSLSRPTRFPLRIRVPGWAAPLRLELNGQPLPATAKDGWTVVPTREWKDGDRVGLSYSLGASLIMGTNSNQGAAAYCWGPFVLAYDEQQNSGLPKASAAELPGFAKPPCVLQSGDALRFEAFVRSRRMSEAKPATLVTFADAGAGGGAYRVWLPLPGGARPQNLSLLADGEESRSREGNVTGSIIDGDDQTFVVTFDGGTSSEDWFAVTLDGPVMIRRVVFAHGKNFHDGGWFDTSDGKPRIQVQHERNGAWETVGEVRDYPATTATKNANLKPGQRFTVRLDQPQKAVALRVIGKPASGDNPAQAFSSCSELEAFSD